LASKNEKANVWMQIVVSLIMLGFGILVLTAPNFLITGPVPDGTQKFAAGWIGLVIGYWLA